MTIPVWVFWLLVVLACVGVWNLLDGLVALFLRVIFRKRISGKRKGA